MIWDVFENKTSKSTPHTPGKYMGSIEIPQKVEEGIDKNLMRFDLHLRKTGRKAYSEKYQLVSDRKKYCCFHL